MDDTARPCTSFLKLLNVMDEIRRRSFRETPPSQIRSMMGLTIRQSAALREVKALTENHPAGIALKVLAHHLQMTMPATSLLVDAMVTKGFFVREPNPDDRRAICIKLSADGNQLFEEIFSRLENGLDRLVVVLSPDERAVISSAADKLHAALYGEA